MFVTERDAAAPHRLRTSTRFRVGMSVVFILTFSALIYVQPQMVRAHSMPPSHMFSATFPHGPSGGGSVDGDLVNAEVRYGDASAGGHDATCEWTQFSGVDPVAGKLREQTTRRTRKGVREVLYSRICGGQVTHHWIPEQTTRKVAESATDRATSIIPRLLTQTAPPIDEQVVNVGTWFWVPKMLWKPVSVTAYIATSIGPITATVTATPTHVIYSPGDGTDPVVCDGPGEVWHSWKGDSATTSCMYTPRVASHVRAHGTFAAKISVRWALNLRTNFGLRTRLPNVQLGLSQTARVLEMQALTR